VRRAELLCTRQNQKEPDFKKHQTSTDAEPKVCDDYCDDDDDADDFSDEPDINTVYQFKGTLRRRLTYIFFSFNKKFNI